MHITIVLLLLSSFSHIQLSATSTSHRNCGRVPSSGHWTSTCSRLPCTAETSSWFWCRI